MRRMRASESDELAVRGDGAAGEPGAAAGGDDGDAVRRRRGASRRDDLVGACAGSATARGRRAR